jgi:outer membrane lipoprotein-sorting protein
MRFLKTVSTRRLLAIVAGVVIAVAGGTAIAVAAAGNGPVPRPERLAQAIHGAISAPTVQGISARITFTNNLIDASDIQGSDPILQGASGRLWLSTSTRQLRLELQSDNGDAQVVVDGSSFWAYDPSSNTAYEGTLPADKGDRRDHKQTTPSLAQIQSDLGKLMRRIDLSGAIPGDVAGQPTYTVEVSPKHDGGLLGDVQLAWDAVHGVPLRAAVYARGNNTPVLELKATGVSYGRVSESDFAVSPPRGAKLVKVSSADATRHHAFRRGARGKRAQGVAAVASRLPFKLLAPSSLVGLPRRSVTLLDWDGSPAALVTYGQNLGGVAVIEQRHSADQQHSGGRGQDLSLPTVSINGATGQELDTELGTVLMFTRSNVALTVLGSVPPAAAEAAARAI